MSYKNKTKQNRKKLKSVLSCRKAQNVHQEEKIRSHSKKVSNFTGDKWFHILLLLSDNMLFIIEKIISTGTDVPGCQVAGVGLYWLTEYLTRTLVD